MTSPAVVRNITTITIIIIIIGQCSLFSCQSFGRSFDFFFRLSLITSLSSFVRLGGARGWVGGWDSCGPRVDSNRSTRGGVRGCDVRLVFVAFGGFWGALGFLLVGVFACAAAGGWPWVSPARPPFLGVA